MTDAIFIDFYGTVVHEDGAIINKITQEIFNTGIVENKSEIGSYWWNEFQTLFNNSYDDTFKTQRELEYQSLLKTINHFQSSANAYELSNLMFEHWTKPPIFEDSKDFFKLCPVPIYIVSNIDRADIIKAVDFHNLKPSGIFTSEDAKSYKPRKELFEFALKSTGLQPNQVVHIGDSLSSDFQGANNVKIKPIWLNRNLKEIPKDVTCITSLTDALDILF